MRSGGSFLLRRGLAGPEEARLLTTFFALYKTARLVDSSNAMFQRQSAAFFEQLQSLCRQDTGVSIKLVSGRYFVNDQLVRFDAAGPSGAASVAGEWDKLQLGGVLFHSAVRQTDVNGFFVHMAQVKLNEEYLDTLTDQLKARALDHVDLLSVQQAKEGLEEDFKPKLSEDERRGLRAAARQAFFGALLVVEDSMASLAQGRGIDMSRTRRVIHALVGHIVKDESSLLELTALKNFDDYTYAHSTNVCIYAVALGVHLGLDRARLSQLGFAALFHDVGKIQLPSDLIRKPERFDEDDWVQMQLHPLLGAKTLLRHLTFDSFVARAARSAFEHHLYADLTGYPRPRYATRPLNLFSQIVVVVDAFDALTSGRVYVKTEIQPDTAFKQMQARSGKQFDPLLLSIFNDIIGVYPAGTLVLLTSDEIALVITNNADKLAHPYVKIVGNREGLLAEPLWADLSLPDQQHRRIVRTVDPQRYDLDISDFILSD